MFACYIFAKLGFYPVCSGTPQYVIGRPAFSRVTLALTGGKSFVIKNVANGEKQVYIGSARLNGRSYTKPYLNHGDVMAGRTVEFRMSDRPQGDFGRMKDDRRFSMS